MLGICNDKLVKTTSLSHSMFERMKRTWWSFSVDCSTYLYTISICLYVLLSNFLQSFQNVLSCNLSCDPILSYLISCSIFSMLCLVHPRIVLVLPIPLSILFLVRAGSWQDWDKVVYSISSINKWSNGKDEPGVRTIPLYIHQSLTRAMVWVVRNGRVCI